VSVAFVTGGSGFIRGRLIERLRADGHTVRALARSLQRPSGSARGAARRHSAISPTSTRCARRPTGANWAFHAAAALGDWGKREEFERGNVEGTTPVRTIPDGMRELRAAAS
jgi:nucleoside-diphosphate-sugar epimerase